MITTTPDISPYPAGATREANRAARAEEKRLVLQQRKEERQRLMRQQKAAKKIILDQQKEERRAQRKEERKAGWRVSLREPHEAALALLPAIVDPERLERREAELWDREFGAVDQVMRRISAPAVATTLRFWHPNAWVYNAHPMLWQATLFEHFILGRSEPDCFTKQDAGRWLKERYGIHAVVHQLFLEQYQAFLSARDAGFFKLRISAWYFTEEENAMIPNIYQPIDDLLARLVNAGAIRVNGGPERFEIVGGPACAIADNNGNRSGWT